MPFEISSRVTQALGRVQKTPAMVVLFDGIDTPFTSVDVQTYHLLDDGYLLDSGIYLDTLATLSTQLTAISFSTGGSSTTTKIDYKIDPDLGIGDSITTMKIAFVNDKKNSILNVLDANELLGRKVRVKITPDAPTGVYPKDYVTIFRGIVDEVSFESGKILLSLSHPDQKKRQTIFVEGKMELTAALTNSATTISVDSTADLYVPILGPDGFYDTSFYPYVRIEDEIIFVGGVTSTTLTGCVRGSISTIGVAHDNATEVGSYYVLQGNPMDLALKIMLSGWAGNFVSGVIVLRFEAPNIMVFEGDIFDQYGLTIGDYITTTGAQELVNNQSLVAITSISFNEEINETTIGMSNSSYVSEISYFNDYTPYASAAFRSRYDTLPSGLRMTPDEVDVDTHENLREVFLSSITYEFYLKGTIENAKDFITKEIYQPVACFAVPKNSKASVGYTIPPLPDEVLKTLDSTNVKDPHKIKEIRQIGRNFYNTIIYKYDEDQLENEFNRGLLLTDTESRDRIPVGNKTFIIESHGLRAGNVANSAADRRLKRYRFAASQIQNVKTLFGDGFQIDIGDNIYFNGDSLLVPDIDLAGGNAFGTRLYQVIQKSIDIKTGDVNLVLLDTNFSENSRYGFISPASYIASVTSNKVFVLQSSFSATVAEYTKWDRFVGATIKVRNADFSTSATGVIESVGLDNTITLVSNLSITPTVGMVMEFSNYDDQALSEVKRLYTHITNGSADFGDGGSPYYMI